MFIWNCKECIEIVTAVVTSLIASLVFWVAFEVMMIAVADDSHDTDGVGDLATGNEVSDSTVIVGMDVAKDFFRDWIW